MIFSAQCNFLRSFSSCIERCFLRSIMSIASAGLVVQREAKTAAEEPLFQLIFGFMHLAFHKSLQRRRQFAFCLVLPIFDQTGRAVVL
jgi:hypothetical protein